MLCVTSGKSDSYITTNNLNNLINLNILFGKFNMASYPDFVMMS